MSGSSMKHVVNKGGKSEVVGESSALRSFWNEAEFNSILGTNLDKQRGATTNEVHHVSGEEGVRSP